MPELALGEVSWREVGATALVISARFVRTSFTVVLPDVSVIVLAPIPLVREIKFKKKKIDFRKKKIPKIVSKKNNFVKIVFKILFLNFISL